MKNNIKLRLILSSGIVAFLAVIVAFFIYGIYSFFTTYGIQSPVLFQSPIYKLKTEVLISPAKNTKDKTSILIDINKIADKIYTLESSDGKNDGCRKMGLFNGYGYRQNTLEWVCYGSHEEVRQLVITWLTNHIKNGDVKSALCMYNQGKVTDECTYSMNYESL